MKQREIDSLLAERQERDSWLQAQYAHIGMLTTQVERAWLLIANQAPGSDMQKAGTTLGTPQLVVSAAPTHDQASQADNLEENETERQEPVIDSERAASIGQIASPPPDSGVSEEI